MAISFRAVGAGAPAWATQTSAAAIAADVTGVVSAGNILIAHIAWEGTSEVPSMVTSPPSGWTAFGPYNVGSASVVARHWFLAKIADGTETTITLDSGMASTNQRCGLVHVLQGRVSGTVAELIGDISSLAGDTDPNAPTVAVDVAGGAAFALEYQNDNNTLDLFTGSTGGTWASGSASVNANLTPGVCMRSQIVTGTSTFTVSGGAGTGFNDPWGVIGMVVRPSPAVTVVERTVAVAATAAVASTPQRAEQRTISVTARGAVASTPQRALQRSAAFGATGQVASSGAKVSTVTRSAGLSARGVVDSAGQRIGIYERSASVSARGVLDSAGAISYLRLSGPLDLTARPSLASSPQRDELRAAGFGASGQITVSAQTQDTTIPVRVTWLELELPAPIGKPVFSRSIAVAASAQVAVGAYEREQQRAAAIQATGAISAQGYRIVEGSVAIGATASITSAGRPVPQRSVGLAATAAITAGQGYRVIERTVAIGTRASIASAPEISGLVTGAVGFSVAAQVAASPQRTLQRSAALAATGAIGSTGAYDRIRSVGVLALASVSAGQGYRIVARSASFLASGAISAGQGYRVVERTVAVSARATVSADGAVGGITLGSVAVTATASIAVAPQRTLQRSASLTASGTVTSTGGYERIRSVGVLARGSVSAQGYRIVERSSALTASVAIGSAAQRALLRTTSFTGLVSIAALGETTGQAQRSVDFTVHAQVAATPQRVRLGSVAIGATAQVSASPQRVLVRSTALAASASFTTSGLAIHFFARSASFTATASLAASPQRGVMRAVAIGATGQVAAAGYKIVSRSASFAATTAIGVTGQVGVQVTRSVSFAATGAIGAASQRAALRQTALSASAQISVGPTQRVHQRSAGIAARGVIATLAETKGQIQRAVDLTARAQVAAVPQRVVLRGVGIAARAQVQAVGQASAQRSVAVHASGAVATSGLRVVSRSVALSATVTASTGRGYRLAERTVSLAANATVSVSGYYRLAERGVAVTASVVLHVGTGFKTTERGVQVVGRALIAVTPTRILFRGGGVLATVTLSASGFRMVPHPAIYTGDSTGLTARLIGPHTQAEIIGTGTDVLLIAPDTEFSNVG